MQISIKIIQIIKLESDTEPVNRPQKLATGPSDMETEMHQLMSTSMMNNDLKDFIRIINKDQKDRDKDKPKEWVKTIV